MPTKNDYQMRMIGVHIGRLERSRRRYLVEHLSDTGMIGHQFFLLMNLNRNPGLSQDELVDRLGVDKSRVARSASFLEKNGYITRVVDPSNKRRYKQKKKKKGEEIVPRVRKTVTQWSKKVTKGLTDKEIDTISKCLELMWNNI